MVTYDNGLYTPWTPADQAQTTAQPVAPAPTSTTVWWTPLTTTSSPSPSSSSIPSTTVTSSTTAASTSSSVAPSSSSSPSISSSTSPSPSSLLPTSSVTTTPSISSSHSSAASALHPSGIIAASSADSSPPPFKITYLLPVFIIVPCVLLFLLAAWTYGKYWAKPRRDGEPSSRPQDQPGFWDGAYKSIGTARGQRRGQRSVDDHDHDEKDGLVIGKDWSGGHGGDVESATPKRKPSSKWTNWLPLGRGASTRSNDSSRSSNHVPFVSVSYASLDQPFVPPVTSDLARSASQVSNRGDRGWTWGTKPRATSSALRVMNADLDEEDEASQYLSAARGFNSGSTRKYRAKKNGSLSSRISDKVMSRLAPGGLSPNAQVAPSPSVYSPQFSPGQDGGRYAELDEYEDDDAYGDEKKVDLDAYLGESRVGHAGMANRYLSGDASAVPPPPRRASGQVSLADYPRSGDGANVPTFAVHLPSAPPRTQVSPKKSQSTLLRIPPPESPRATPPPQLLFGYDSPPPPRGPLPIPNSQSRSNLGSDPFTSPPTRLPFRSQPAPQLSRPSRANTSTPFSPETAPGLFFASPPLSSPPSQYRHSNVVGSPMPDFQPGALRASESAFSIAGVDKLIFADPSSAPPPSNNFMNPNAATAARPSESRTGLRDLVQKPKSRRDEIEQLRRSVGPRAPTSTVLPPPPPEQQQQQRPNLGSAAVGVPAASRNEPRESLGFNPNFAESPTIAPLQHPSRVRAAIETLEAKSSSTSPSSSTSSSSGSSPNRAGGNRSSSSSDGHGKSGPSIDYYDESIMTRPERLPTPPAPQKLERSTTTLGKNSRRTQQQQQHEHYQGSEPRQQRRRGRDRVDRTTKTTTSRIDVENGRDDDDDEDDEETIMNRRVSTLLLSRSRTQSGGPTPANAGAAASSPSTLGGADSPSPSSSSSASHDDSESHPQSSHRDLRPVVVVDQTDSVDLLDGSSDRLAAHLTTRTRTQEQQQQRPQLVQRPLSSDPVRLQQMLRRKSTGANLVVGGGGAGTNSSGTATDLNLDLASRDGRLGGESRDESGGTGSSGVGIVAAMTRRSGIFD